MGLSEVYTPYTIIYLGDFFLMLSDLLHAITPIIYFGAHISSDTFQTINSG